jgi:hypothetical protein
MMDWNSLAPNDGCTSGLSDMALLQFVVNCIGADYGALIY